MEVILTTYVRPGMILQVVVTIPSFPSTSITGGFMVQAFFGKWFILYSQKETYQTAEKLIKTMATLRSPAKS